VSALWISWRVGGVLGGGVASAGSPGTSVVVAVLVAFALVAVAIIVADYWFNRRGR
jgi:hypothetical protein